MSCVPDASAGNGSPLSLGRVLSLPRGGLPRMAYSGPRMLYSGPRMSYSGPRMLYSGPRMLYSGPRMLYSGPRMSYRDFQRLCRLQSISSWNVLQGLFPRNGELVSIIPFALGFCRFGAKPTV
jgi:hypothetical protein